MNAFIYFLGPSGCGLDEIEDALDEALSGGGSVTGTGSGASGSNVDVTITDPRLKPDEVVSILSKALESLHVSQSVTIQIDGRVFKL